MSRSVFDLALALGLLCPAAAPGASIAQVPAVTPSSAAPPASEPASQGTPARRRVLLDDRRVREQAPSSLLARAEQELGRRRTVEVVRLSAERARRGPRVDQLLARCTDEELCLPALAMELGVDDILQVRVTRREEALFVAMTRQSALRPQIATDAATLVATEAEAAAFVADGIDELWPGSEVAP